MFSEIDLVEKAGKDPSAWQSFHQWKTKTCSKNGGRVSYVFDHNKKDKYFDICIKQKPSHAP